MNISKNAANVKKGVFESLKTGKPDASYAIFNIYSI
jgi:hypothetical protein